MTKKKNILPVLIACFLWASAFPALKILYIELNIGSGVGDKLLLAGLRFIVAGIMILSYYTFKYRKLPIIKERTLIIRTVILGLFQTALMYLLYYNALYYTTGIKTAVLSQVGIFGVVILSYFVLGEVITKNKIIGLIIGVAGVIFLNVNSLQSLEGFWDMSLLGEGFILISSLIGSIGTIMAKVLGKKMNPILMTGWQMTIGSSVLLVIGFVLDGNINLFCSLKCFVIFIYTAFIASVAFTIWFNLLQHNKASDIAVFRFTIPIIGAILSAIFIPGESFNQMIIIGLILVSYGIYYCNKEPKGRKLG